MSDTFTIHHLRFSVEVVTAIEKNVQTSNLEDIVRLADEHRATTVSNLLVAFGLCQGKSCQRIGNE